MVMKQMRRGVSNVIVKNLLFGLLMLAAIGLALSGGNVFSAAGVGQSNVARIGKETISLQSFDRNLRRTLGRVGMGPTEAYRAGYVDQFLSGEVRNRIMNQAARQNDILVSRRQIAGQVRKMIEPMVGDGQDSQAVLKQILMSQGMSERELTDSISRETASGILSTTIQNGFNSLSDDYIRDLYLAQGEMRDVEYVIFPDSDLKDLPPPSEDNLKKLYESTKETYAIPETRALQIIRIKDEALKKTLEITDEELKQAYETNKDSYYTPPQRTLEQAALNSEDTARKLYDAVKGGKSMEAAAGELGQISSYLGAQDVVDAKLPPETKDAVLAAKEGDVLEPVKTELGWNVARVKKISGESTKSFESVKEELKNELYETKMADQKYALANQLDDLLASGISLEEAAKQVDIEIKDLPSINSFGLDTNKQDMLKNYPKISSIILDVGFKLGEEETSAVSEMADGSFAAIRVKSMTPKTYEPFEKVKTEIQNNWMRDQAKADNRNRVVAYAEEISSGKKSLKDVASASGKQVKTLAAITHKYQPQDPLTGEALGMMFATERNKPTIINTEDGTGIAMVTSIRWPEKVDESSDEYKKFKSAVLRDAQNESLMAYLESKTTKYRALVNKDLLAKAYGQSNTEQ